MIGRSNRTVSIFVKIGPSVVRNAELERYIGGVETPHFIAPQFFGETVIEKRRVAAWEYVCGQSPKLRDRHLVRVVDAVADMNCLTFERELPASIPVTSPWIEPVSSSIIAWADEGPDGLVLDERLKGKLGRLHKAETEIIDRYKSIEHKWLCHHDIKYENVVVRQGDHKTAIIDWASTTVSVPGASLRFLAWRDEATRVALSGQYVERIKHFSPRVSIELVDFAITTTQTFWALVTGMKRKDPSRVTLGLSRWPGLR